MTYGKTGGESDSSAMEALQTAGKIIIENGGETYRAEETICRMGEGFGLHEVESFAVPSGLFISYRRTDGELETSVKRVRREERNLTRVDETNRISRLASEGKLKCSDALEELKRIETMEGAFPGKWSLAAACICATGFSVLFGGKWIDMLCAGAVALTVQWISMMLIRFHLSWLANAIAGGLLTAMLPSLIRLAVPAIQMEAVVAGALMPLVPGLSMTTAVQDAMRGDMVSGLSHGARALLTACLIAGGALLSSGILRLVLGGGH